MKTYFIIFLTGILGLIANAQDVTFTKVTTGDLVNDGGWSYSMLWMDFNDDGFPDLFVTNNDANNGQLNFLYMNNGDGTFTKITEGPVVNDGGSSYSCSAADVNGDNSPDLFVANYNENNFLYFGNGDGTFDKVTTGPIVTDGGKSVGAAWADYNLDGWLDLYVANRDQQNFLYKGLGNGEFEKITTGSIVTDVANSSGCAWGDYDNDGLPDLYVANSGTVSNLYHNYGGTFTKVYEEPFISDVSSCSGASWGDCDNDGDLDLFVSTGQLGMYVNWFYLNDGDGTFTKVTDSPLVNEATWSSGSAWGDYDKDGDLDLAVGGYDGPNLLFKNDGSGNFEKVLNNSFVNNGNYTEGLAWADADNDGDLDIFTAKNNYFGGNNSYFLNDGNSNNWIKIKLHLITAIGSNPQAIGGKIWLTATINGLPVTQYREVNTQTGGGQGGQNDLVQFFGLGDAVIVNSISVNVLGSGGVYTSIPVNQTLEIEVLTENTPSDITANKPNFILFPNPASDQINLEFSLKNQSFVQIQLLNIQGQMVKELFADELSEGKHELQRELNDQSNNGINSGTYFVRLICKDDLIIKKIIVLKN